MRINSINKSMLKNFGSAVMNMALLASPFSTGAATNAYYASRRANYGRNNSYLIDEGLNSLKSKGWKEKLKDKKYLNEAAKEWSADDLTLKKSAAVRELVVVDSHIHNTELFSKLIKPGVELLRIESNSNGFDDLMNRLGEYKHLNAIHLFAHAQSGQVLLGNQLVNQSTIENSVQSFSLYNETVNDGGELLIYNCQLESHDHEKDFLEIITNDTDAKTKPSDHSKVLNDEVLDLNKGNPDAWPKEVSIALNRLDELAVTTVEFSSSSNGATSNTTAAQDAEFSVGSYTLEVDGANTSTYTYFSAGVGSDVVTSYYNESSLTVSFVGGETFTLGTNGSGSIRVLTFSNSSNKENITITSNLGDSKSVTGVYSAGEWVDLTSFTPGLTSITITADDGNSAMGIAIDDLSFSSISSASSPEINVQGNNVDIADGDASPSAGDHTDFGSTGSSSGANIVRTFTIQNTGTGDLDLTGTPDLVAINGTNAADFSVTTQPDTDPIPATNGSTTFQITFDPSAVGTRTATVSIANDDTDENPYTFAIEGFGINTAPSFTIGANQTVSQSAGAQTIAGHTTGMNDNDGGGQTLTFNVSNDNTGIFDVQPDIDESTGNLTFTPKSSTFGKATVTVSLSDDGGTANGGDDTSADQTFDIFITPDNIRINEVHEASTSAEFVEIYDGGTGSTDLSDLVLIFYNGDDASDGAYSEEQLTGSTDLGGFYVVGETGVINLDQDFGSISIQNGTDAVALYVGSASDFINGDSPITDGLVDVIVYGNTDDSALRAALGNPSLSPLGDNTNSISRNPDGTGVFEAQEATPGFTNNTPGFTIAESSGSTTVTEAGGTDTYTVVLDAQPNSDVMIDVTSWDTGEATVSTSSLTFTAANWNNPQTVTVTGVDDDIIDGTQIFNITLSINDGSSDDNFDPVVDQTVSVDNTDDDVAGFTITVSSRSTEVTEAGGTDDFDVVLDAEPSSDVVIDVTSDDVGEATVSTSSLTFTSGNWDTPQTVTVTGQDDDIIDGTQTFNITLSINDGSSDNDFDPVADQTVSVDNTDDDVAGFTITESAGSTEVTEAGGTDDFDVVLDAEPNSDVVINVISSDVGEATVDQSSLTFTSSNWDTPQTITVTGVADNTVDLDQTFNVTLSINDGSSDDNFDPLADKTVSVDNANTDQATVTIADISGNEDDGAITVTATLDLALDGGFDLDVSTADGTATLANNDYTQIVNQTLTFAGTAGETQTFTVSPTADGTSEGDETLTVSMSGLVPATVNTNDIDITDDATLTILGDDAALITVDDPSVAEGASGTTTLTYTVSLSQAQPGLVTVDYATSDGTATAGEDYTALTTNTLTFAVGETSKTVDVTISGDEVVEVDETITLTLSNNTGTSIISDAMGTGTITNDDQAALTITDITPNENDGTASMTFTLNAAVDGGFDVDVSTADNTGTTADGDYTAITNQTITFAGTSSETETVTITLGGDTKVEADEIVDISMSNLVPATADGADIDISDTGTVTITNDDAAAVTITDITPNENDGTASITFTLDAEVDGGFDVDVSTADNTATIADGDYTAITNQTITFAGTASETETVTITLGGDTKVEADEIVDISMSNLVPATADGADIDISDTGTVTITNDDAAAVTITDITPNENDGTASITFTLNAEVDGGFDVDVSTADNTATIADGDYTAITNQTITFAGTASETEMVTITLGGDTKVEADEIVDISMTNLVPATADASDIDITDTGTVTITNDDAATVTITDITPNENDGTASITFTLDATVDGGFDVDVSTADNTATIADGDYTAITNQTITFAGTASETETVTITLGGDTKVEADEIVDISMSNLVPATVDGADIDITDTGTVTITNDDQATVTIADISGNEDDGANTLTATLDNAVDGGFTVEVSTADGTAVAGTDYTAVAGQVLTFAGTAGETQTFIVTPTADAIPEGNETLTVSMSNLAAGTVVTADINVTDDATVTITGDDQNDITIDDPTITESEAVQTMAFTVSLSSPSVGTTTVDYATSDGTATAGSDYTSASGTVTFNNGETNQTIDVTIAGDAILEASETLTMTLSNPTGTAAVITDATGTGTITDNDAAAVTIADVTPNEDDGTVTVTAALDNAVQGGFTVKVSTADGTATTADSDYTAVTAQTLTFTGTAGETQTFAVTPNADTKVEADETITLSMSNLAVTTLSVDVTDNATVTITNDDQATVTIADVSGNEDDGAITLTATLDNAVDGGFTVEVSTADGTAVAGTDYTAVAGQVLTFAGTAGETQTFNIIPTDDGIEEAAETITVSMSNLAATTLAVTITDQATVTIIDDDDNTAPAGYTVSMDDVLIGGSELTTSTFTFAGAELGATYNYTVSSNGGGTNVTGTGTIATATDQITLSDLSGLGDGLLTLSVTLTDASSNTGSAANSGAQLDTTAPDAPIVSSISADSGANGADGITNDNTLSINGTAEANSTVEVFIDGVSIGTTSANGDGEFSFDHTGTTLAESAYTITAQATDAAGNTGNTSTALNITVDTTAPVAPTAVAISTDSGSSATDGLTSDQTLTITGTAEANSTVQVFIGGTSIGSTTANGTGAWSFDHSGTTLAEATYAITAAATDAAGNTSTASSAFGATIDTTAPAAPTVDLEVASDLGVSDTDNLTNDDTPTVSGTAEANSTVTILVDGNTVGTSTENASGEWTFTMPTNLTAGDRSITATATDAAGNEGAESTTLQITIDTSIAAPALTPADNAVDVLPSDDLIITFDETVYKGAGNITIKLSADDSILEEIDVTSDRVSIAEEVVTIDPENPLLPPSTEFYVMIDAGALVDEAGNEYVGINNNTAWTFTTIDASVVTSVNGPSNDTYGIGDELEFTVNFSLAVTTNGTIDLPFTLGSDNKSASLVSQVDRENSLVFSYTIEEGDLDTDGISLSNALTLSGTGSSIEDNFRTSVVLGLNNAPNLSGVLVDGVKPKPTISANAGNLINTSFMATFTFDEAVTDFAVADIAVTNGTASNFTSVTAGTVWTADITPSADGEVVVTLLESAVNDLAGNPSEAGNSISTTFDGTAPEVTSITRAESDQIPTGTTNRDFTITFSEEVTGVDVTDFEVVTTGTAAAAVNTVVQLNGSTYTVNVNGISGEGTIGLNAKDDDTIIDAATNALAAAFTGEVYNTNFQPTDIGLSSTEIQENNAVGEQIATLTTTDADAGDRFSYSLVAGAGDTDNGSFIISDNQLLAGTVYDFETKDSYSIRLRTEDNFGGSFEEEIIISITNEPEAIIVVEGDGAFEQTILGLSSTKSWTVTNNGDAATEVRIINTTQGFSINPGSVQVNPGESVPITAVFTPWEARSYTGVAVFNFDITDDIQDNVIEIGLSGEGVIVTGVDRGQLKEEQINVFPNPAKNYITIDLSELQGQAVDIQMVDPSGAARIAKEAYDKPELRLDVTNYVSGIYIIQFSNDQSLVRKKVIIKK